MESRRHTVVRRRAGEDAQMRLVTIDGQKIDELQASSTAKMVVDTLIKAARNFTLACSQESIIRSTIKRRSDQNDVFGDAARFFEYVSDALNNRELTDSPFGRIIQPPGTGKTVIMGEIVAATGANALILVPSRALVDQHKQSLSEQLPTVQIGVWSGDEKNPQFRGITIATYQMLQHAYRTGAIPPALRNVTMVFADEAHEAMTDQRMLALRDGFHPATIRLAFTATPDYSAQRTLATYFPTLVHEITMHEAVKLQLLSELDVWAVYVDSDASEIKMIRGDYDEAEMARLMSSAPFFEACRKYRYEEAENAKIPSLICCRTRQQALDLTAYLDKFRPRGSPKPEVILGDTSRDERRRIMEGFDAGEIDTIVNVGVLLRGWDAPHCKLLIDLAPSCSLVRAKQKFFRPMRKFEGKVAKLYMLLPQNLPQAPVFPSDFFGKSIAVSLAGEAPTKQRPGRPYAEVSRTRTKIKSVRAVMKISLDGVRANPDLHPGDVSQMRAVIGANLEIVYCVPSYGRFRNLGFKHELFTGPGIALLRYCGVRDLKGYYTLMERLYPGAGAMRYFPPKERAEYEDKWCEEDNNYLLAQLSVRHSLVERERFAQGWRALYGEDDEDASDPHELYLRELNIQLVRGAMDQLRERHTYVVERRFGFGKLEEQTLKEIGLGMSLSIERVRLIEHEALGNMQMHINRTRSEPNQSELRKENDRVFRRRLAIWTWIYETRRKRYPAWREEAKTTLRNSNYNRDDLKAYLSESPEAWEDSGEYRRLMAMRPA